MLLDSVYYLAPRYARNRENPAGRRTKPRAYANKGSAGLIECVNRAVVIGLPSYVIGLAEVSHSPPPRLTSRLASPCLSVKMMPSSLHLCPPSLFRHFRSCPSSRTVHFYCIPMTKSIHNLIIAPKPRKRTPPKTSSLLFSLATFEWNRGVCHSTFIRPLPGPLLSGRFPPPPFSYPSPSLFPIFTPPGPHSDLTGKSLFERFYYMSCMKRERSQRRQGTPGRARFEDSGLYTKGLRISSNRKILSDSVNPDPGPKAKNANTINNLSSSMQPFGAHGHRPVPVRSYTLGSLVRVRKGRNVREPTLNGRLILIPAGRWRFSGNVDNLLA